MITDESFKTAMAMMKLCGLKVEEDGQMQIWKILVNDLDQGLFERAILDICKGTEKFWESDNVPGMIRARVQTYKDTDKRLKDMDARKEEFLLLAEQAVPMPEEYRKVLGPYSIPEPGGEN